MNQKDLFDRFRKDTVSVNIIKYIRDNKGSHLNELDRELDIGSRVTILDRLIRMEKGGILNSEMVYSSFGEAHIQRWIRKYKISDKYKKLADSL